MNKTVAKYLARRTFFERWPLMVSDTRDIEQVVAIPLLAEFPDCCNTLQDLANSPEKVCARTLVVCVINNRRPECADAADLENNRAALGWLHTNANRFPFRAGYVDATTPGHELPDKDGVGLARKLGMDWGLRILAENDALDRPLICLDGDTRVQPNYLAGIDAFFHDKKRWGGFVSYAHPLDGEGADLAAILCYEFFLRYHALGLTWAGSPYAFPSIGSTLFVSGNAYAAVSGMNRRLAGEDFYFLQQVAKTGPVDHLDTVQVYPSSRPSHRVPFGTGRRVRRFLDATHEEYVLYHPKSYQILRRWLATAVNALELDATALLDSAAEIAPQLARFLLEQGFQEAWPRLQQNSANPKQLQHHFHHWFDGFRTLKLVHHLRDHGYPDQEMFGAIKTLLQRTHPNAFSWPDAIGPNNLVAQKEVLVTLRAPAFAPPKHAGLQR